MAKFRYSRAVAMLIATAAIASAALAVPQRSDRDHLGMVVSSQADTLALKNLRARVAPPSDMVFKAYRTSGAEQVRGHELSEADWRKFDAAILMLPLLHRQILLKHLRHLMFVETAPGAGNALTARVAGPNGVPMFDLTLRSGLFDEDLTTFLNGKEPRLFAPDNSGYRVEITAGNQPALTYILLHEITHAVDQMTGANQRTDSPFRAGIWLAKPGVMAPPYDSNPVSRSAWRHNGRLPMGQSTVLYRGLCHTPFPSIYAATTAAEDFAELVAWEQLSTRGRVRLRIDVKDRLGRRVATCEPLKSPLVRARFRLVEDLLASAEAPHKARNTL